MTHIIEISEDFDPRNLTQETSDSDIQRVMKLIKEALTRSTNSRQYGWCVIGYPKIINGKLNYLIPPTYDGYFLRQDKDLWIVGDSERGHDFPIAIFPGDLHEAAKYFVWKVSKGASEIDWSLYLD